MKFTPTPFQPNTEGVWLDLPAEIYHAAPGKSATKAKRMHLAPSPAHYKAEADAKEEPSAAMEFGTLLHTAILEPDLLPQAYHLRPDTYPSKEGDKPWNGNSTWCKEWLAVQAGKPVLKSGDLNRLNTASRGIEALPDFQAALANGWREVSFFKRDEATGHLLKCRADLLAGDAQGRLWVWDLKSVQQLGNAAPAKFSKHAWEMAYHIQAAAYMEITGAFRFVFVPIETEAPFACSQLYPDAEMLWRGAMDWRTALDKLVQCEEQNRWPSYSEELQPLSLPAWVKREM